MLQVDVFTVEAVSLGQLSRLAVGHDESTAGGGWYLADVTVAESDKASSPQIYFPCNRLAGCSGPECFCLYVLVGCISRGRNPRLAKGNKILWKLC